VDSAGDAVLKLHVQLRQGVAVENACIPHVSLATGLDHVANLEALHGLVLRNAAGAVGAADDGSVSTSVLISTTIPPFLGHGLSPAVRTLPSIVTNLLKDSVKLT